MKDDNDDCVIIEEDKSKEKLIKTPVTKSSIVITPITKIDSYDEYSKKKDETNHSKNEEKVESVSSTTNIKKTLPTVQPLSDFVVAANPKENINPLSASEILSDNVKEKLFINIKVEDSVPVLAQQSPAIPILADLNNSKGIDIITNSLNSMSKSVGSAATSENNSPQKSEYFKIPFETPEKMDIYKSPITSPLKSEPFKSPALKIKTTIKPTLPIPMKTEAKKKQDYEYLSTVLGLEDPDEQEDDKNSKNKNNSDDSSPDHNENALGFKYQILSSVLRKQYETKKDETGLLGKVKKSLEEKFQENKSQKVVTVNDSVDVTATSNQFKRGQRKKLVQHAENSFVIMNSSTTTTIKTTTITTTETQSEQKKLMMKKSKSTGTFVEEEYANLMRQNSETESLVRSNLSINKSLDSEVSLISSNNGGSSLNSTKEESFTCEVCTKTFDCKCKKKLLTLRILYRQFRIESKSRLA